MFLIFYVILCIYILALLLSSYFIPDGGENVGTCITFWNMNLMSSLM